MKCEGCKSTKFGVDTTGLKYCKVCGIVVQEQWNGRVLVAS